MSTLADLERLANLRSAYDTLQRRIAVALQTQIGDATQLNLARSEVLQYLQAIIQHRPLFPAEEYAGLERNLATMLKALDDAHGASSDTPDASHVVVTWETRTGRRGRPRKECDVEFLAFGLDLRGPTGLAPSLGWSSRTVSRRAVEYGLREPGAPVFQYVENDDGSTTRVHQSSTAPVSTLTDEELDTIVAESLQVFPNLGHAMLNGRLVAMGHTVPRARVRQSFIRVHGVSNVFGRRRIHRRKYKVAGANALWHHDGQHGLIRWKLVMHAFVDGHSRMVTAFRVSNNNRAETVLDVFLEGTRTHGVPSRVRGDHGGENVLVAQYMEDVRGPGRGSYIWGRSVHNTRIERLWYDVTSGFGQKWNNFFYDLEMHCSLNPDSAWHIWLLHYLFLSAINDDAAEWVMMWNNHTMQLRDQRNRSPRDMFFFSCYEDGLRGLVPRPVPDEPIDDISQYGVDWEANNNPAVMNHFLTHNPHEWDDSNPFRPSTDTGPSRFSYVACEAPGCPFYLPELQELHMRLLGSVDLQSKNMMMRRMVWEKAYTICEEILDRPGRIQTL